MLKKFHKCGFNDPRCLSKPRLFGCICGKGDSSSSSTATTVQEDNRVVADSGGLALGRGAGLQITQEFPDKVAQAFSEIVDLGKQAITASTSNVQAIKSTVENKQAKDVQGNASLIKDVAPFVAVAIIGSALISRK